jgi:hypothetical protein
MVIAITNVGKPYPGNVFAGRFVQHQSSASMEAIDAVQRRQLSRGIQCD